MKLDDPARLRHILEAAQEAVAYTGGQSLQEIRTDRMRALALTRLIEIIGAAASTVTPEYRATHPELPWRSMAAMRNRLIHAYFDVDLSMVYDTATEDLPPLIESLKMLLDSDDSSASVC